MPGEPETVFKVIMDNELWRRWDGAAASQRVLEKIDDHTDVLHIILRPVWIWPTYYKPRGTINDNFFMISLYKHGF